MTTFDRLEWHLDAAIERGQPAERAFTHVALYAAWLARNGLLAPDAVADERLASDQLTPDGDAFTEWYYPRYLDDYAVAFADRPDYTVADDAASYERIGPTIDRRHEEWVALGRPGPDDDEDASPDEPAPTGLQFSGDDLAAMTSDDIDEMARQIAEALGGPDALVDVPDLPHDAPDLEALLPMHVDGIVLEVSSSRARAFGSSLLLQAIGSVGADADESYVAVGLGGAGEDALALTLYAIPGVAQDRLEAEFSRDVYLSDGQSWERREVAGKVVWWAASDEFDTAFYALGGLVVTAGGSSERVRSALDVLP